LTWKLPSLQGTPFLDDVRSVMSKLEQRMSAKEREELAAFGERFMYMPDHAEPVQLCRDAARVSRAKSRSSAPAQQSRRFDHGRAKHFCVIHR
jgi:hypothetical protein